MSASGIVLEERMLPIWKRSLPGVRRGRSVLVKNTLAKFPSFEVRLEADTLLSQAGDQPPALVWTGETRATRVGSRSRSSAG